MGDNHTDRTDDNAQAPDGSGLRLIDAVDEAVAQALPEGLADRVEDHVETLAEHLRAGLLAASTAVGLEVMAELMDAEVDALTGPQGKHGPDREAYRHGQMTGRSPWAGDGWASPARGCAPPTGRTSFRWTPTPRSPTRS